MSEQRIAALEARIIELERGLAGAARTRRRSYLLTTGALGIAALVFAQSASVIAQSNTGSTFRMPFKIVNARNEPVLLVDSATGETRLDIIADNKVVVRMSGGAENAMLAMTKDKSFVRLGLNVEGENSGASLQVSSDGKDVLDVDSSTVTIGDKDRGAVQAGTSKSGDAYVVVNSSGAKQAIELGTSENKPWGVYVKNPASGAVQASLGLDTAQRGLLRVGAPGGVRGVLGLTGSGGMSFGMFDGVGADYRVSMVAAKDLSYVRVKTAKSAVHVNAEGGSSAIHVFNSAGNSAASLEASSDGTGEMTVGDAAGNTLVEATVTNSGLGVVRAGPDSGGRIGAEGVPFAILGRKGK